MFPLYYETGYKQLLEDVDFAFAFVEPGHQSPQFAATQLALGQRVVNIDIAEVLALENLRPRSEKWGLRHQLRADGFELTIKQLLLDFKQSCAIDLTRGAEQQAALPDEFARLPCLLKYGLGEKRFGTDMMSQSLRNSLLARLQE